MSEREREREREREGGKEGKRERVKKWETPVSLPKL
jgi:hypothetical protein